MNKDIRCPKCKGEFVVEATTRRRFPTGFGFQNSPAFQIDVIEVKSYRGFCLECGYTGEVEFSRRRRTLRPRSINNKLRSLA